MDTNSNKKDGLRFETLAIRQQIDQSQYQEHSVPLFMTSSFTFDSAEQGSAIFQKKEDGYLYSRFSNPNSTELVQKLCALENCETGIVTASGMAAIYTCFAALLKKGDHILASKDIFGNAHYIITEILPNMGIDYTLVDVDDNEAWQNGFKKNTKLAYLETPSNPTLKTADMTFISQLCTANQTVFAVDNCFATPYLQNPSQFGADIVIHSATKYMDGQGRVLGGAILGAEQYIALCADFLRRTGASLSPFNAWILSKSLETLALRMDRHCSNASRVANFLEQHPLVESVVYPHLPSYTQYELAKSQMRKGGGLVGFYLKGGLSDGSRFLNRLHIHSLTANLGDTRSIATHPASTTHSKMSPDVQLKNGIKPNYIRLSVGLEHADDLIDDIAQALNS